MTHPSELVTLRSLAVAAIFASLGCTQTTLEVPRGDVASPESHAEPMPSASPVLDRDFDPIDPNAKPTGHEHHHHGHGEMPMPAPEEKSEPKPAPTGHENHVDGGDP